MKGHQIIGELRLGVGKVVVVVVVLKGHQIIGELRLVVRVSYEWDKIEGSPDHW